MCYNILTKYNDMLFYKNLTADLQTERKLFEQNWLLPIKIAVKFRKTFYLIGFGKSFLLGLSYPEFLIIPLQCVSIKVSFPHFTSLSNMSYRVLSLRPLTTPFKQIGNGLLNCTVKFPSFENEFSAIRERNLLNLL